MEGELKTRTYDDEPGSKHYIVVCGCWNDGAGNHLDSFDRRIKKIYGSKGAKPNLEFYTEYMSVVNFFKAMKELRERFYDNGGEGL